MVRLHAMMRTSRVVALVVALAATPAAAFNPLNPGTPQCVRSPGPPPNSRPVQRAESSLRVTMRKHEALSLERLARSSSGAGGSSAAPTGPGAPGTDRGACSDAGRTLARLVRVVLAHSFLQGYMSPGDGPWSDLVSILRSKLPN